MKRFVRTSVAGSGEEGDARRPELGGLEQEENVQFSMYDEEPDDNRCMARVTAPEDKMMEIERAGEVTVIDDKEARKVLKKHTPHADLENLDQPDVEVDEMLNEHDPRKLLSEEKQLRVRIIQGWTQEVPRERRHELLEGANVKNVGALIHQLPEERLREIVEEHRLTGIEEMPQDTAVIVRSAVTLPSRGNQVLLDQEFHAIKKAAEGRNVHRVSAMPDDAHQMVKADLEGGSSVPEDVKKKVEKVIDGHNREHQELLEWVKGRQDSFMHSV